MSPQSPSLQTPVTGVGDSNAVDATVMGMDLPSPAENNEESSLLHADEGFDPQLSWQLGAATTLHS